MQLTNAPAESPKLKAEEESASAAAAAAAGALNDWSNEKLKLLVSVAEASEQIGRAHV